MSELRDLKLGDEVCLVNYNFWSHKANYAALGVVEKLTNTQVTAFGGRRFFLKDGREFGGFGGPSAPKLQRNTPEVEAMIGHCTAQSAAENICHRVAKLLEKAKGDDALRLAGLLPDELRDGGGND